MKPGKLLILILLLMLLTLEFCSEPLTEVIPINISGTVLNQADNAPIEDVVVRLFTPDSDKVNRTDANGDFLFTLGVDSTIDISLIFNKEGFVSDTVDALAVPERDINLSTVYLIPSDMGGGDTTVVPGTGTTGPSTIALTAVTSSVITVIGSGGADHANIGFQVQDSSGLAVGRDIEVAFSFGSSPDGGEYLSPLTVLTDKNGEVDVNLVSGTKAGVVQIIATVNVSGTNIRSQAVPITIHGGLPDSTHFGLATEQVNFPGYGFWGRTNTISAFAGDKYGNFCTPGTAIYFTTNGGMIDGSSLTENGSCAVKLVAAPPYPEHPTKGKGFATITARTANENNKTIETSIDVLFSGAAMITNVNPDTINIPDGGSQDFSFTVADVNGNPLSKETSVKVSVQGDNIGVLGGAVVSAVGAKLPDTQGTGPDITEFSFTVFDNSATTDGAPVRITITTDGLNGPASHVLTGSSF